MAKLSIKEGIKAYVKDMEREIKEDWGKWLSDEEHQQVMDALAAFAEEELAFMETAWSPENQGRLENQMRALVDDLIKDAKAQANDSGTADDFDEEDFFSRIKITVDNAPQDDPAPYKLNAEIEENQRSGNEDACVEFTIATPDMDYRVSYPRPEPNEFEADDDDIWGEREIESSAYDHLIENGPQFENQSGGSSTVQEEEMSDNIVAHSQPASQQGNNSGVADYVLDDTDFDDRSLLSDDYSLLPDDRSHLPRQEGLEHELGEDVMESIEKDASIADDDDVIEYVLSEGPDAAPGAGASNYREMGKIHNDSSPIDFSSDGVHSEALLRPMDVEDEEDPDRVDNSKGKQPQQGNNMASPEHYRHKNNHLWDVVVDADKPNGTPAGYICKFASCNGRQGKWTSRKSHYEAKHAEEWFAFTGKRQRVYKCLVDGCGWSTTTGKWYLRVHEKDIHGFSGE